MVERIHCEWAQLSDEPTSEHQDELQGHADHGDQMNLCDAWVCICGNKPQLLGFYPCDPEGNALEPDGSASGLVFCDQCQRIIDQMTGTVFGFRPPEARDLR